MPPLRVSQLEAVCSYIHAICQSASIGLVLWKITKKIHSYSNLLTDLKNISSSSRYLHFKFEQNHDFCPTFWLKIRAGQYAKCLCGTPNGHHFGRPDFEPKSGTIFENKQSRISRKRGNIFLIGQKIWVAMIFLRYFS